MGNALLIFILGIFVACTVEVGRCQEMEPYMDETSDEDVPSESPSFNPFEQRESDGNPTDEFAVESDASNRSDQTIGGVKKNSKGEIIPDSEDQETKMEIVKDSKPVTPANSKAEKAKNDKVISQLHQNLVSQVVAANQQQAIFQQGNPSPEPFLSSQRSPSQGQPQQILSQATDGQLYTLFPVEPETPPSTPEQQEQKIQAQAAQLQMQAEVQQIQAAQLQRLQEQLAAITKSTSPQTPTTYQEQQPVLVPTPIPQDVPIQFVNPGHYLFDPRLPVHPQPLIQFLPAQHQYFQLLQQQQEVDPSPSPSPSPLPRPVSTKRPHVLVEQSVLPSQSFKEQVVRQKPIETHSEPNINKLVADIGLGYSPVEDTPHYTIYKVNDPEPRNRQFHRPSLSHTSTKPQQSQASMLHQTSYKAHKSQPRRPDVSPKPIRIVPADAIGFNYKDKPENLVRKPQTVYKSTVDPEYYNAVKNKLISSFSNNRFRPFPNGYGPPPPLPLSPHVRGPKYNIPEVHFRDFEQLELLREPPRGYDRKPFRPSPVDLGPFHTEPLFEPIGHNQPVEESSINFPNTVHPPKFSSKYVDIDYSPGIALPPNEAAFAAIQARKLGGPAFIDPGYLSSALGFELNGKILEPFPSNPNFYSNAPHPHPHDPTEGQYTAPEPSIKQRPKHSYQRSEMKGRKPESHNRIKSQTGVNPKYNIPKIELKEIDVSRRPVVPPQLLAKILRATTGDEVELENYY